MVTELSSLRPLLKGEIICLLALKTQVFNKLFTTVSPIKPITFVFDMQNEVKD